ncbi:MAG: sugar phosphate isomerase/epimerase [Chloroflexi bacterium]|nr:sugar phosphate isomerase/epimerase [Chloroflexota bacterium]
MPLPLGLQLYTVRDALQGNFEDTVRRIAAMGYAGVEAAGFPNTDAQTASQLFNTLGLQVPSAHAPLPLGDDQADVLRTLETLGCKYMICPYQPPEEFTSVDGIKRVCDRLNAANDIARANGYIFGYHNHHFEYIPFDGQYPYQIMLENLSPDIVFEIDTYWVQTAGADVNAVLNELGDRVTLLHIKDGPCVLGEPQTAVGAGKMDVPAILAAASPAVEWLIVELDHSAGDMLADVENSYTYLTQKGLARGRAS